MNTRNHLSYESLLQRADKSVSEAVATVGKTYRLNYHFMPQAYWMNDPNGLVFFNGYYHVFYQHHPYSSEWGSMHWGHARTKDFIDWEHLPISLAPSEDYDADGCLSGSAVVGNGVLHLFYTGQRVVDGKTTQVQCRATSLDGVNFVKDRRNPLISDYPPEGSPDFRDPKVWEHSGVWFMALASGKDGIGKVLLYKSRDLSQWEYAGVLAQSDGTQGAIWECPDVFSLGGKHVLVVSPIGREPRRVIYFVGTLDYESGRFTADYSKELDHGPDFYAFGTERRLLLAWMDAWDVDLPSKKDNWAGAFTIPRELVLDANGCLRIHPLPELRRLRKEHFSATSILLDGNEKKLAAFDLKEAGLEIILQLDMEKTTASHFGIVFTDAQSSSQFSVGFKEKGKKLYLDTNDVGSGRKGIFSATLSLQEDRLELRIFVDRSSIEIFSDNGVVSLTSRIYPSSHTLIPHVFVVDGKLEVASIERWSLAK